MRYVRETESLNIGALLVSLEEWSENVQTCNVGKVIESS